VRDAVQYRQQAGLAMIDQAEAIARVCHLMARRFHQGGKLIAFGNGLSSTDAQHIAVEFVHPVIVGKRALPAISLTNDTATLSHIANYQGWDEVFAYQLKYLARSQDIALGLAAEPRCPNVRRGLEAAKAMGLLTLALMGGASGRSDMDVAVDYRLAVPSDNPLIVKEVHITLYHMLWELVHVCFDHPGLLEGGEPS
jgi:D-sedoheptulose 7-phosphate isomerase